ncbi:MAG: hypothetical protein HGA45_14170 [Chloroflexales bacterium]|nr:hypothetical protein [Chloroflexales bacterium]
MLHTDHPLHAHYDGFWQMARPALATGAVELDPHLSGAQPDGRRGLSLILRPPAAIAATLGAFLAEAAQLEPGQYIYPVADLHLTVLSLFTATVQYQPHYARLARYRAATDAALQGAAPVRIAFRGITAVRGAVMIQGFPADEGLNQLRDRLRQELHAVGLGGELDRRYQIRAAHLIAIRFAAPLCDAAGFCALLELSRERAQLGQ